MGERKKKLLKILLFFNLHGLKKKLAKNPSLLAYMGERRNCKSPTLLTYYIGGKKKVHSANYIVSSHLSFLSGKL
jgi:hypothetical protein